MPVLEDLLPEPHNKVILDLAFDMATWHAYAKLRKHTKYTIRSLRSQTKEFGRQLRHFANNTCSKYKTKRLPSEEAARIRCNAGKAKKQGKQGRKPTADDGSDVKHFSLTTYKVHALGDYADHIEKFGPTDCFTTQHVILFPSILEEQTHEIIHRASASTGGLNAFTNARTKVLAFNTKLQSRRGCNGTTESTPSTQARRSKRDPQAHNPERSMKAGH